MILFGVLSSDRSCLYPAIMSTQPVSNITRPRTGVQARVRTSVKGLLALAGLQQKDLAAPLGTTPNNISAKLVGRNKFSLEEIEMLAEFFGVDVVDLLDPDRWRPKGGGPRGGGLLRLDSNQEPAGFRRLKPRAVLELAIPTQRLAPAA